VATIKYYSKHPIHGWPQSDFEVWDISEPLPMKDKINYSCVEVQFYDDELLRIESAMKGGNSMNRLLTNY
jgi:hypothetical protein